TPLQKKPRAPRRLAPRDPDAAQLSLRLDRDLLERVIEAAKENLRPLTYEVEHRLRQTFEPPSADNVLGLQLLATWRAGGARAMVNLLLDLEQPSEEEWALRWHSMRAELARRWPAGEKSGFGA